MILVFYAGQLYGEYHARETAYLNLKQDQEIYNGAYEYHSGDTEGRQWYRMDWTPVLLDDVPKELRLLVLLLT